MRYLVAGLSALLLGSCTEPVSPLVGEYSIVGVLTSEVRPSLASCPLGQMYCKDTVAINEPVAGVLTVPDQRTSTPYDHVAGVTIVVNGANFQYEGRASTDPADWDASAQQNPGTAAGPRLTLTGTFAADSIVGTIHWGYGHSAGTVGWKTGTFVAKK